MSQFKAGDVVELKSGGPRMTVTELADFSAGMGTGPKDGVKCEWFDTKHQRLTDVFDARSLKLSKPPGISSVRLTRS